MRSLLAGGVEGAGASSEDAAGSSVLSPWNHENMEGKLVGPNQEVQISK